MHSTISATDGDCRRQPPRNGYRGGVGKTRVPAAPAPWLLQGYMAGEIDLNRELAARFATMPHMSIFRGPTATHARMASAVLSTQDGAATLTFDLDTGAGALQCSFTLASMLSLRFHCDGLSNLDREHWLDVMRDGEGDPAFLWSEARWNADYLICSAHRYYTHVFAFSPLHVEAAARLTPEVTRKLIDWLQGCWFPTDAAGDKTPADALTW